MRRSTFIFTVTMLLAGPQGRVHAQSTEPSKAAEVPTARAADSSVAEEQASEKVTARDEHDAALANRLDRLERQLSAENRAMRAEIDAQKSRIDEQKAENELLSDRVVELSVASAVEESKDDFLKIYGFFDINFGSQKLKQSNVAGAGLFHQDVDTSFIFGNLNTYFDFNLSSSWRMLFEIRFLINPGGDYGSFEDPAAGTKFKFWDVRSADRVEFGNYIKWGGVVVERAHAQWNPRDWFCLTAGVFLTPFGIWNVDHASTARLFTHNPILYHSAVGMFPSRQLGLKLSGRYFFNALELNYAVTVSNGRGEAATLVDFDSNKALGGRLTLGSSGALRWRFGLSAFSGTFTDFKMRIQYVPSADVIKEKTVVVQETFLGADVQLEYKGITVVGESLLRWNIYDDEYRDAANRNYPIEGYDAPDSMGWGAYAAIAYRLPFDAISLQPYVRLGHIAPTDVSTEYDLLDVCAGINWRITPDILFRVEYNLYKQLDKPSDGRYSAVTNFWKLGAIQYLGAQLAVSFSE